MNSAFNLYLPQTLKTLLELKHELSSVSWASFDLRPFLKERKKSWDHSNPIGNQFLAVTTKTIGKMNDFFIFADSTSTSASSSSASRLSLKIVKKRRKKCFCDFGERRSRWRSFCFPTIFKSIELSERSIPGWEALTSIQNGRVRDSGFEARGPGQSERMINDSKSSIIK